MRHLLPIVGPLSICVALVSASACAEVIADRYAQANATSHCQTALPVFDGNVRKRPLAVQNEGNGDAFVTCSFTAQGTDLYEVRVALTNSDPDLQAVVSCTAVTGHRRQANEYLTKSALVQPSSFGELAWVGPNFPGLPNTIPGSGLFSLSCKLPPGTGIGNARVWFFENVGD